MKRTCCEITSISCRSILKICIWRHDFCNVYESSTIFRGILFFLQFVDLFVKYVCLALVEITVLYLKSCRCQLVIWRRQIQYCYFLNLKTQLAWGEDCKGFRAGVIYSSTQQHTAGCTKNNWVAHLLRPVLLLCL